MKVRKAVTVGCLLACVMAHGQGRDSFIQQQAYAEMQRVSGQIDVLQSNLGDLQQRIGALEGNGDSSKGIRQELDALKESIAEIRREMKNLRSEIVKDLSGRIAKMQTSMASAPAPRQPERKTVVESYQEYTVQSGDNLSLISQAFGTSVAKIKDMNNLKSDSLRIGQRLKLPK